MKKCADASKEIYIYDKYIKGKRKKENENDKKRKKRKNLNKRIK